MAPPIIPVEIRFWSKVNRTQTCWLWTGRLDVDGYGNFTVRKGQTEKAHRVAFKLKKGPVPVGLLVLHRCDVPACVRPKHLFLGTHRDNQADKVTKGRQARGSKVSSSKLTKVSVLAIRASEDRQVDLAVKYGVSQAAISAVITRKVWGHI